MSPHSRPLALSFPLHGSRLIEASAGTGKTYTISALYLRLILGHGGEAGFATALLPPQILVVTFTDAATRELRDRIRLRLVEAARVFAGETDGDPLLHALRNDFDVDRWPACAQQLSIAAQWMDEAAVSTIHGWCQRMLREHAFDSGSLFKQELNTDPAEQLQAVIRDYWRQHSYPLAGDELDWVRRHWGDPDRLGKLLQGPLKDRQATETGEAPLQQLLQGLIKAREQALATIKQPWHAWIEPLSSFYAEAAAAGHFNGTKLGARTFEPRLARLREWLAQPQDALEVDADYFKRFTHEGLQDGCKKGVSLDLPPAVAAALDDMASLPQRLAALPGIDEAALRHAAAWVRRRFAQEQRQRAEMGFEDMLTQLDEALHGPRGEHLAEVIRQQFPVAMVDEFQDTDPVQYRIFDRIYHVAAQTTDRGLFMIGDPKQAIYAFRGADIHTYLQARRATAGRHYELDTNFRSTPAMVAAVNQLFERAEQRPQGRGAFLFRRPQDNPLPFLPVQARGRPEVWTIDSRPAPALTLWHLDSERPLSGEAYRQTMAEAAASELVRLLNQGQHGEAGFAGPEGWRSLQAQDIAVLVRDGSEARAIREAMARRGIRSVYLSDKDSVFASQEARDVLLWLKACAEPGQDRLLRAALASRSLALPLEELERLNLDELHWESRVDQFRDYHDCWQKQGVLPMLRRLIHAFRLPARLMQEAQGERRLTNLLHLAELLQQAAAEHEGEQALIRHFSECLADQAKPADEQVIRLESDEALLRVVTIHKSKGLEYPLVFLPFVASFRAVKPEGPLLLAGEVPRWIWQPAEADYARAEDDRLAEDLRLLYVALTRARHGCWLGLADRGSGKNSQLHRSAIGYLLAGGHPLAEGQRLLEWLQPLAVADQTVIEPLPEAEETRFRPATEAPFQPIWREPARAAAEAWWIASYSALRLDEGAWTEDEVATDAGDRVPDTAAMQNALDDEPLHPAEPAMASVTPGGIGMHRFPRGAASGTFLHGLLELAAESGFKAEAGLWRDAIARRCELRGLTEWIDTLTAWLEQLCRQPLPLAAGDQRALADVSTYQSELEFWIQTTHVDVRELDRLVCRHELPGLPRPALLSTQLNGMFKGFVDLCFEADGRYYLIDYKSNWLGEDETAYDQAAMQAAIAEHRYDLQYVLYTLALHRQLQLRLPDYDYDRHVGGAIYMFVRAPAAGLFQARPDRDLIEALDRLFRHLPATNEDAA
ncbi:exodeoxyribonuclease V subunit beta [Frateuria aurantia]|uniref:RecBCD enzyme subunit RecB n=1 Tax=Frateuria aurantia (strain ATCC 33424 / DSM 6220 / KCTC 2777 / LMG 1558 / NBRC 3245 / NCIMB 13370) TaxID=767434 RepID=H8L503_FRAAD|nr:exodeoxyribonuclease V subunit beta [Frateuria aurantia]AFC85717.1 exodeoxyribonuclease V, beta subunit [Frateuria aurantia DSM 6220]